MFIIIFFSSYFSAQTIPVEWQKNHGGSYVDHGISMQKTPDGGYILLGQTNSSDRDVTGLHGSNIDLWLVKTNNTGVIQWSKCLGGTGAENAAAVITTDDGGYLVIADTRSNNGDLTGHFGNISTTDAWIVKLNNVGTIEWQRNFGGTLEESAASVVETSQGFLLVGHSFSNDENIPANKGATDAYAALYSHQGTLLWAKNFGGSGYDYASSVVSVSDGFVIAGNSNSENGDLLNAGYHPNGSGVRYPDFWVYKIDLSGNVMWSKYYGGPTEDIGRSIAKTADGGYVITGKVGSYGGDITDFKGGPEDFWVLKIDSGGIIQWKKCYGGSGSDYPRQIKQTQDNGYIVIGDTYSNNGDVVGSHNLSDIWVLKISGSGTVEWQRPLGGSKIERGYDIVEADGGGFVALGSTASQHGDGDVLGNPYITPDLWLVKLNAGLLGTAENQQLIQNELFVYPNPGKDFFSVNSKYPVEEVKIYTAEGKLISALRSVNQPVSIKQLTTGIYFIHIKSNGRTVVKKLLKE